jgi:ABC-type transport system involved in multi-copper enzyme maturation permease subunit
MSVAAIFSERIAARRARRRLGPFLTQEYLRIMRSRTAMLIWAMMIYALLALPFIMQNPQPELVHAIATWLGSGDVGAKLLLFMWVDAAMNKLAMIMGPVLAGGIIVDERDRGSLDLFASKPWRAADYFTVKLVASWGAFATFYIAGVVGATMMFPWRVPGFDVGDLLTLSAVHLFAALFALTFSATMAVVLDRKLIGMLASFTVLATLVGFAFLGFWAPNYRTVSYLNPFFDGVVLIGSLHDYGIWEIIWPILLLVGFNLVVAAIGRHRATVVLEEH